MCLLVAFIVCAVIVLLTLQRKCWRLIWQLNGFLGILQQPFLWLLLLLYLEPQGVMDGMQRWRKYFRRPFAIIVGTRIFLYIDDPNTMEQVLTAHECQDKTFLQEGFFARKGLLHARGQQWKIRRKQLNPAFGHSILLSFFHIFNSVGNQLQDAFSEQFQGAVVSYKDVEDLLSKAVLEVSCQTTLGTKTNFTTKDTDGIARTYKKLLEISALRIIKPWLQNDRLFRLLDRRNYDAYVTCNKLVQHFVQEIVQRKHETWLAKKLSKDGPDTVDGADGTNGGDEEERPAVGKYAASEKKKKNAQDCDESKGNSCNETDVVQTTTQKRIFIEQIFHLATLGEMTLEDIMNETHAMILVSFETVSNSLIIALLLLAMHPDCQHKLRCEINAIFSDERVNVASGSNVESGRSDYGDDDGDGDRDGLVQVHSLSPDAKVNIYNIDATQLQQMKYLDMIVNESLRLLTTVPVNLRHVSSDFQLRLRNSRGLCQKGNMTDSVVVPQDSVIVVDTFNMQRDSSHWGPKAQEFMPEHFANTPSPTRHPYAFIPFSKGLRSCIGWRYSELLMKIFLVKLISCYEFRTQTQLAQLRFIQGISLKFRNSDSITFQIRQLKETK